MFRCPHHFRLLGRGPRHSIPHYSGPQHSGQRQDESVLQELRAYPHKIVFEAYADDNWELFQMNADGTGVQNLTNTPDRHEMYPQTSPDGQQIAFLCDELVAGQTVRSVEMMNLDASQRRLICDQARQPCWSPDGKQIAFVKMEFGRFNIKTM